MSRPGADQRTREILRRLELDVTRRLDGMLQGDYRGLVSGLGSEPGEARPYAAGDDVRRMDWNVTARMGEPHVRHSVADRELATTVLADLSPSLDFGTAQQSKADLVVAAVAAIGLLTDRVGNRFSSLIVDGARLEPVRAGSGRRHLMATLQRLRDTEPKPVGRDDRTGERATLADGLRRLAGPGYRGGLAVVVSDLLSPGWQTPLRATALRHETLVIEVVDQRELELPDVGIAEFVDATTGEVREINTGDAALRARFAAAGAERLAAHAAQVRKAGADHVVLRTDGDWVIDLARFVDRRRRTRGRMTAGASGASR